MNKLEQQIISSGWFKSGRTLRESIEHFIVCGYHDIDILYTIINMDDRRILYSYPSKIGMCYRLTVQADKELDIGV